MELGEQLAAKGQTLAAPQSQAVAAQPNFSGEDPEKWNTLCQKRRDDALTQKTKDRKRTNEAYEFVEGNPYDLTGAISVEKRWYFRLAKMLLQEIIGTVAENGFEIAVKADPPPDIQDPDYIQSVAQYAQQFGLDPEDHGKAASEMLTHGENTLNERAHLEVLVMRFIEHALTDGPGAVYCYTGVDSFSPDVVVKQLVPAEQMWLDGNANSFYEQEWFCRDWPTNTERLKAKFPEWAQYFEENKGQGKKDAQARKDSSGQFDDDYVQEHFFRSWEQVDDGTGYLQPKWPGNWVRVWRYGNKILRILPLTFLHEEPPYDQLLGLTKMRGPQGTSFALDVLYGPVMAKNRAMNTALQTMEKQGQGKRVIDTGALVNPEDLYDDSLSNLGVLPGYDLNQVVKDLIGPDIAPSVKAILDIMAKEVPGMVGQAPPPGAVGGDASDAAKTGRNLAPFRTRLRDFLARISKKSVSNLIQFDDKARAWQTMGNVGPPVIRYWAGIFRPIIENTEAYFTIQVSDKKQTVNDPVKQAEITKMMIELAQERANNPLAPIPYSKALELGPDFEDKDRQVRIARIAEAEAAKAEEEAKASGQPSPQDKAVAARNQIERGQGAVEVVKKAWQQVATLDPYAVLNAVRTGAVEQDFKIAQGVAPLTAPTDDGSAKQLTQEIAAQAANGTGGPAQPPQQPGPEAQGAMQ